MAILNNPTIVTGGVSSYYIDQNQYVNLGASAYHFTGTAAFTLEAWIKVQVRRGSNAGQYVFCCFQTSGGTTGISLLAWFDAAATYQLGMERYITGTNIAAISGSVYNLGETHHVVGTYDGTNSRFYVDGALINTGATDTRSIPAYTANMRIGNDSFGTTYALQGYVDEPAIYTRALPLSEIQAHYNAGL